MQCKSLTAPVARPTPALHARLARRGAPLVVRASSTQQSPLERAVNSLQVAITNSPLNKGKVAFFKLLAGSYDEAATRGKIQNTVAEHPVTVFGWTFCPFVKRARQILTEKGVKFHTVEIDKMEDGKAIKAELGVLTGRTSVPSIWIGGQCIGGCNDGSPGLIPLVESGELESRLRAVNAL